MNFSDLPNQGHNLRLYTYDPPGTTYYSPSGTIYNTGHYDIGIPTGPCSLSDPQGFNDSATMNQYAANHGEMLVLVNRADLPALCAATAPSQTQKPVIPPGILNTITPINTGTTFQGGVQNVSVGGGPASPSDSAVAAAVQPSATPGMGTLPTGSSVGQTVQPILSTIYRFILNDPSNPAGPWSTGANYPGCSQTNSGLCDARAFPTQQDAIDYAINQGEVPYLVSTASEVWQYINGSRAINPAQILGSTSGISSGVLALIGLGLWFLSGR